MKTENTNAKKHRLSPSFVRSEDRKTFRRWYNEVKRDPADVAAKIVAERLNALSRFNKSDAADDEAHRGAADKAVTSALNALRTRLDIMADAKGATPSGPAVVFLDSTKLGSASQITAARHAGGGIARILTAADGDRLTTLIECPDGAWREAVERVIADLGIVGYEPVLQLPAAPKEHSDR